jgi:hypothetical protein
MSQKKIIADEAQNEVNQMQAVTMNPLIIYRNLNKKLIQNLMLDGKHGKTSIIH